MYQHYNLHHLHNHIHLILIWNEPEPHFVCQITLEVFVFGILHHHLHNHQHQNPCHHTFFWNSERRKSSLVHEHLHPWSLQHGGTKRNLKVLIFLAPQSGALRMSAYGDFQSHPNPTHPLITFGHLSLSIVIRNNASRPRQINVD